MATLNVQYPFTTETWVATPGANLTVTWQSTGGNPGGCWDFHLTRKKATQSGYIELTTTWAALGIPSGATINKISTNSVDWRCDIATALIQLDAGPLELRDSGGTLQATLNTAATTSTTTSFATKTGTADVTVPVAINSDTDTVKFRFNVTIDTDNVNGAEGSALIDNIDFTIDYTEGAITLTTQETTHNHTVDNTVLTHKYSLTTASATHNHTVENVNVTPSFTMVVQESSHVHTVDSVNVTVKWLIVTNDAAHVHTSENVNLIQAYTLTTNGSSHSHTADNLVLTTPVLLSVNSSTHTHTVDSVVVTSNYLLITQDTSHNHVVDNTILTSSYDLTTNDTTHNHTVDNVVLSFTSEIEPQSSTHNHTADNITVSTAGTLTVASTTHNQLSESPLLSSKYSITTVNATTHNHTVDNVLVSVEFTLVTQSSSHSHTVNNLVLTSEYTLVVESTTHPATGTGVILTSEYILNVNEATHQHTADNISLSNSTNLIVGSSTHNHTADNIEISSSYTLSADSGSHSLVGENVTLIPTFSLETNATTHNHTSESVVLTSNYLLTSNSSQHTHTADNTTLEFNISLSADSTTHNHTVEIPSLTVRALLAINSTTHNHTTENVGLIDPDLVPDSNNEWNDKHVNVRVPINNSNENAAFYQLNASPDWKNGAVGTVVYNTYITTPGYVEHPDFNALETYLALDFSALLKYVNTDMLYGRLGDARNIVPGNALSFRGYPTGEVNVNAYTLENATSPTYITYAGIEDPSVSGISFIVLSLALRLKHRLPYPFELTLTLTENGNPEDVVQVKINPGNLDITHVRLVGEETYTAVTGSRVWFSRDIALLSGDITYIISFSDVIQAPYYGSLQSVLQVVSEAEYTPGNPSEITERLFWTPYLDWSHSDFINRVEKCAEITDVELDQLEIGTQLYIKIGETLQIGTTLYTDKDATITASEGTYLYVTYEYTQNIEGSDVDIFTINHYFILNTSGQVVYLQTNIVPGILGSPCFSSL